MFLRPFRLLPLAVLTVVAAAPAARGEILSFGLKGGVPFNDVLEATPQPTFPFVNSNRYTLGPAAELHLPAGLGIEVDALYRSAGYRDAIGDVSGSTWSFPLLLKSRFLPGPVKPLIEAGASFRHLSDLSGAVTLHPPSKVNTGMVLGCGLEVKALIVRLSGELRYTRYFTGGGSGLSSIRFNANQAEVLFGITF